MLKLNIKSTCDSELISLYTTYCAIQLRGDKSSISQKLALKIAIEIRNRDIGDHIIKSSVREFIASCPKKMVKTMDKSTYDYSKDSDEDVFSDFRMWFTIGRNSGGLFGEDRLRFQAICSEMRKRKLVNMSRRYGLNDYGNDPRW